MKITLLIFLIASTGLAHAQTEGKRAAPACGPDHVKFNVKTAKERPQAGSPDAGKALVYFLEDDSAYHPYPKPTTRMGVDGEWVGATHGNSFFYFSVDPGEHFVCARHQALGSMGYARVATGRFKAEAGATYYFVVRNAYEPAREGGVAIVDFGPVDSNEGRLMAGEFSYSTFELKK